MAHVFSIVDPGDVRYVFLSHDDADHVGNLREVLDLCPRSTLVTNMFTVERMASDYLLPIDRVLVVNDGDRFSAADRDLLAVVPPTFDSPTTRGLVRHPHPRLLGSGQLRRAVPTEFTDVAELPADFYHAGLLPLRRGARRADVGLPCAGTGEVWSQVVARLGSVLARLVSRPSPA